MKLPLLTLPCLLLAAPWLSLAAPNLPVPLKLPPGLVQTLSVNSKVSYFGDAVRIVDCPKASDNPLGTCDNWLFGGLAMWDTHIAGNVQIRFYPPIDGISHFEISHPSNLTGTNTIIQAPQGYEMRVRDNFILDALDQVSQGDLNLNTGEVLHINYAVLFSNTWYADLTTVNPRLKPPDFTFPGIYGSANYVFTQRKDGLLDVTFIGSSFLPLNNAVLNEPVVVPMPYCGLAGDCTGVQAPGTSLHPHIYFTTDTAAFADPPCGTSCANLPVNTVQNMTGISYYSSFGDDFNVVSPQLGGIGRGRTHLQGRLQLQYGPQSGDIVPVFVSTLPPLGQMAPVPVAPAPLSTFKITMIGHTEFLRFPLLTYKTADPILLEDGFDFAVGQLNVNTGTFFNRMTYRGVPAQDLFVTIINLNITRIPLDTFRFRGPGYVRKGPNGETVFGYDGTYITNFETFQFPSPNLDKPSEAFRAGPGSDLTPFMRFQAAQISDAPKVVKTGSGERLLSSVNQPFSYSYSINCDPSVPTGSFDYTNHYFDSSGGTFHMDSLSSVSCTNFKTSVAGPGDYDTVTFVGYGTWSRDLTNGRHLASVQVSNNPNLPLYVSIQIDGGLASKVHLKPPLPTVP